MADLEVFSPLFFFIFPTKCFALVLLLQMFKAIEIGDAKKVNHLLTTGCTVNVKDKVRTEKD